MENILKQPLDQLHAAPLPIAEPINQIRTGKIIPLGPPDSGVRSAIAKEPREGPVFFGPTGPAEDEHEYKGHGGPHRAVHQYATSNYPLWRTAHPSKAHFFKIGGFGENLITDNLTEENICVGDVYRLGKDVLLEVSEPRVPCSKLNLRFELRDALQRVQRTGRCGWYLRVIQTGYAQAGDTMALVERPNPKWSILNTHRVLHGKKVPLHFLEELIDLKALSPFALEIAQNRLDTATRTYKLVDASYVTTRVKHLTFALKDASEIDRPDFKPFAFAQIKFGPNKSLSRCYSVVSGDLTKFSLGVALDDNSRGGSIYLHKHLQLGEEIDMAPGYDAKNVKNEKKSLKEPIENRIVIIGGIGVTAFLPAIKEWETEKVPFEVHYAVRNVEDAAYKEILPVDKTTYYAKSNKQRLNVEAIVPGKDNDGIYRTRVFCCGPTGLMDACKQRTIGLDYPPHMVHFESFGVVATGEVGDPFQVEVRDPNPQRAATLEIPSDKSLLQVLNETGFDIDFSCQAGSCGLCKVSLCQGQVDHKGVALFKDEEDIAMLNCVDRGKGKITIEID